MNSISKEIINNLNKRLLTQGIIIEILCGILINEGLVTEDELEDMIQENIESQQDYIDKICRMAWRPQIVVDEYQNFTTFKPYRRRYYTDYVGAVYLHNRSVQQLLRLSVWQGDYYRELASCRIKMQVESG